MSKHHSLGFVKLTMPNDKVSYVRSKLIEGVMQADKNDDGVVAVVIMVGDGKLAVKTQPGAILSQIEEIEPSLR